MAWFSLKRDPQDALFPVAGYDAQRGDFAGIGHVGPDAGAGVILADVDDPYFGGPFRQSGEAVTGGCLVDAHPFVPDIDMRCDLFVDAFFEELELFGRQVTVVMEVAFRFFLLDVGRKGPSATQQAGDRSVEQMFGAVHHRVVLFFTHRAGILLVEKPLFLKGFEIFTGEKHVVRRRIAAVGEDTGQVGQLIGRQ